MVKIGNCIYVYFTLIVIIKTKYGLWCLLKSSTTHFHVSLDKLTLLSPNVIILAWEQQKYLLRRAIKMIKIDNSCKVPGTLHVFSSYGKIESIFYFLWWVEKVVIDNENTLRNQKSPKCVGFMKLLWTGKEREVTFAENPI